MHGPEVGVCKTKIRLVMGLPDSGRSNQDSPMTLTRNLTKRVFWWR